MYKTITLTILLLSITLSGCVKLPETTAENVEERPTATVDIDATVMAMFEALNAGETVKKALPADKEMLLLPQDGIFHGQGTSYNKNGNPPSEGVSEDGIAHGQGKVYNEDETLI